MEGGGMVEEEPPLPLEPPRRTQGRASQASPNSRATKRSRLADNLLASGLLSAAAAAGDASAAQVAGSGGLGPALHVHQLLPSSSSQHLQLAQGGSLAPGFGVVPGQSPGLGAPLLNMHNGGIVDLGGLAAGLGLGALSMGASVGSHSQGATSTRISQPLQLQLQLQDPGGPVSLYGPGGQPITLQLPQQQPLVQQQQQQQQGGTQVLGAGAPAQAAQLSAPSPQAMDMFNSLPDSVRVCLTELARLCGPEPMPALLAHPPNPSPGANVGTGQPGAGTVRRQGSIGAANAHLQQQQQQQQVVQVVSAGVSGNVPRTSEPQQAHPGGVNRTGSIVLAAQPQLVQYQQAGQQPQYVQLAPAAAATSAPPVLQRQQGAAGSGVITMSQGGPIQRGNSSVSQQALQLLLAPGGLSRQDSPSTQVVLLACNPGTGGAELQQLVPEQQQQLQLVNLASLPQHLQQQQVVVLQQNDGSVMHISGRSAQDQPQPHAAGSQTMQQQVLQRAGGSVAHFGGALPSPTAQLQKHQGMVVARASTGGTSLVAAPAGMAMQVDNPQQGGLQASAGMQQVLGRLSNGGLPPGMVVKLEGTPTPRQLQQPPPPPQQQQRPMSPPQLQQLPQHVQLQHVLGHQLHPQQQVIVQLGNGSKAGVLFKDVSQELQHLLTGISPGQA